MEWWDHPYWKVPFGLVEHDLEGDGWNSRAPPHEDGIEVSVPATTRSATVFDRVTKATRDQIHLVCTRDWSYLG